MTDDEILKKWHENKITFELSPYKKILEFARALLAAGASEGQAEPVAWQFRDLIEGQWTKWRHANTAIRERYKDWPDVEFRPLYLHPSAELAALRARITELESKQ